MNAQQWVTELIPDREMVRKALECIAEDRQKSCTGCKYSIFGLYPFCVHGIARDVLDILKEQEAEIRQLRLALDIAKGTCKGIVVEGR